MSPTIGCVFYANDDDRYSSQEAMNKIEDFYFVLVTSELHPYPIQNFKGSTISLQDCSIWKDEVHGRDLSIWIAVVAQIQQGPHVKELKCHIDVRSKPRII
jgi:hypothetical protein